MDYSILVPASSEKLVLASAAAVVVVLDAGHLAFHNIVLGLSQTLQLRVLANNFSHLLDLGPGSLAGFSQFPAW